MKSLLFLLLALLLVSNSQVTAQAHFDDEEQVFEKTDLDEGSIISSGEEKADDYLDDDLIAEVKNRFLAGSDRLTIVHGDYEMKAGRRTDTDLLVINGSLTVAGTLDGHAVVANGNIILKESGIITRNAVVVNGKMIVENSAQVEGDEIQMGWSDLRGHSSEKLKKTERDEENCDEQLTDLHDEMQSLNKEMRDLAEEMKRRSEEIRNQGQEFSAAYAESENDRSAYRHPYRYEYDGDEDEVAEDNDRAGNVDWEDRWNSFGYKSKYNNDFIVLQYNRVNGLLLGGKLDKNHRYFRHKPFQIFGQLAYSFGLDRADYQFGVNKFFGNRYRFEIGGEFHDQLQSNDDRLIGNGENTINALLFKRDFKDYFLVDGFSLHAGQSLNRHLKLTGTYRNDRYVSADNQVNWALFRPKQDFRLNPGIDEGHIVTVAGRVEFNTVSEVRIGRRIHKRKGWAIAAEGERGFRSLNSDFHFSRYTVEVVHYHPLSRWENLDTRVMVGSATGDVPLQKLFYVGGISTMRGHGYKEFSGNQMALANVEYRIHSRRFSDDRIFFIHPFSVILFADAGYAWNNAIDGLKELADGVRIRDVETDLGIGFGDEKDLFRIDFAKNVSRADSDYKINLRLNYAF